jgi:competence protein ComEA
VHHSFDAPTDRQARSLLVAAVGALVVALVGWWLVRPAAPPIEATLPLAGVESSPADGSSIGPSVPASSAGSATAAREGGPGADEALVVQAAGAVHQPGVHRLPPGSRVDDLVRAAGGFTSAADRDRVNLAAPLLDGERVWLPARGEEEAPEVVAGAGGGSPLAAGSGPGAASAGGATAGPTALVDLNRATAADLESLPGVGPATASAILAHREQIGSFTAVEQLLDVRGIGEVKLEQLRPLVRV